MSKDDVFDELEAKRKVKAEKISKKHKERKERVKKEEEERKEKERLEKQSEQEHKEELKRRKLEGMKRHQEEAQARLDRMTEELRKKRIAQREEERQGALKILKRRRILARRAKVSELYCKGVSMAKISEALGVSITVISKDLVKLRKDWLARCRESFDTAKAQELARIDLLESKAWEGYEKSLEDKTTKHKKNEYGLVGDKEDDGHDDRHNEDSNGSDEHDDPTAGIRELGKNPKFKGLVPTKLIKEIRRVGQAGDPRYMEIVLRCIETRSKICGLFRENNAQTASGGVVIVPWAEIMRGGPNAQLPTLGMSGREGLVEVDAKDKDAQLMIGAQGENSNVQESKGEIMIPISALDPEHETVKDTSAHTEESKTPNDLTKTINDTNNFKTNNSSKTLNADTTFPQRKDTGDVVDSIEYEYEDEDELEKIIEDVRKGKSTIHERGKRK